MNLQNEKYRYCRLTVVIDFKRQLFYTKWLVLNEQLKYFKK